MSLVNKQAPAFTAQAVLADNSFGQISLDKYKGKWVVLFSWPFDFTFVCPTEITAFSDQMKEFEKRNAAVLGFSIDSHFSHLKWKEQDRKEGGLGQINFPLISDLQKSISSDYGVLLEEGMALRSTFIIDPDGVVQFSLVHALGMGRNVNDIIRSLDALQFTAQNGQVCPANWTPGEDSITPEPSAAKEFFGKK